MFLKCCNNLLLFAWYEAKYLYYSRVSSYLGITVNIIIIILREQ